MTSFEGEGVKCPLMTIDDEGEGVDFSQKSDDLIFERPLICICYIYVDRRLAIIIHNQFKFFELRNTV